MFVDVAAEAEVPALGGPVAVAAVVAVFSTGGFFIWRGEGREGRTYGTLRTWVGRAAIWSSLSPRLLLTASPVGKPWKKLGTPEATYDGMSDPSSPRMLETSPARSLMIPLRDL